ncbi:Cullin-2 [Camponotus floridanus]|uniref:Cullin-2 n=1 Tax=Camponotus floridanus TaxID=104421 RepID=E2ALH2_CAMFO|nr:cullin-2 [Camponotus floridanus]XP_011260348.1 cullin-2 [Camponotus floridanus]XP_011260350.1 cullin-2 [Camponotus floridanus]XP_011260351.1 cullin-2 [Camponotus floridanus]XP_011260352.1 cullin-2 [Camponotus floridanus]EFN65730.1 Cullin-2 [Camponotus floridanus]
MSLKPKRVDFNQTWHELQETVKGVITLANIPRAIWNDRFSDVYSLCVAYPEPLADRLYDETKRFLVNHVDHLLVQVDSYNDNSDLLTAYHRAWTEYSQGIYYLHSLYLYLNQQHIKKQKLSEAELIYGASSNRDEECQEQMEIGELGLDIWKKKMIIPLREKLVSLLLVCIDADRDSKLLAPIDVICGVIQSFVRVEEYKMKGQLNLYQEAFEEPFLKASKEFYMAEALSLLQQLDVTRYMEKVTWRLNQEEARAHKFLHKSSVPKVRACCEEKMVDAQADWLHAEAEIMIKNESKRDLALLYPLLRPLPGGLDPLVQKLTQHITQQGLQAIGPLQGENVYTQFVESMLNVHSKYSELIRDVFKGDQSFVGALDKACSAIVNYRPAPKQPVRAPELLAKYCDSLLKKSPKAASESEIEDKLRRSITVFKYVDDKDVFQKFYSRMLAKRLIHQQSQSMDAEEMMIDDLKRACGYEFTNKLHRMFTDMSVSADLNAKFTATLREGDGENQLGTGFGVKVLQAGAWPLALPPSPGPFHVPQQLEKSIQAFETFYHMQFSGRKLTWLHHLSQGELKFNYLKKSYLVTVQTYQMALLLLFEHCDAIPCREAAASLRLSHDQLIKHAASLVDCKILNKSTEESSELEEDTILTLNFDYSNKRTKFRVTGVLQRDAPQDAEATHRSVDEDRKMFLQAAIVRIMKSRKLLRHNQLIQEVLSQSKVTFAPSIGMIKKCIETLIDKQYIERTANSADEYSYIA